MLAAQKAAATDPDRGSGRSSLAQPDGALDLQGDDPGTLAGPQR
jgi:hypothetical protein